MNLGAPIVIAFWALFALWVVFGLIRDMRANRRALRDPHHCDFHWPRDEP